MNTSREPVEVARDCAATTVPSGGYVTLRAGERVRIVQMLGGTITVRMPTRWGSTGLPRAPRPSTPPRSR